MQPILVFATIGAALAMSIGYLGTNVDMTMVQEFGVGETDIQSPVDNVSVAAVVSRLGATPGFKDFIIACVFESPEPIEAGSFIICKLLSESGSVIGEGKVGPTAVPANQRVTIPLTALQINNVHDLILIVQGP